MFVVAVVVVNVEIIRGNVSIANPSALSLTLLSECLCASAFTLIKPCMTVSSHKQLNVYMFHLALLATVFILVAVFFVPEYFLFLSVFCPAFFQKKKKEIKASAIMQ